MLDFVAPWGLVGGSVCMGRHQTWVFQGLHCFQPWENPGSFFFLTHGYSIIRALDTMKQKFSGIIH